MLAYVALADRPPTRRRLAEVLFGEADGPLRALRWNLTRLRRVLDSPRWSATIRSSCGSAAGDVLDTEFVLARCWVEHARLEAYERGVP